MFLDVITLSKSPMQKRTVRIMPRNSTELMATENIIVLGTRFRGFLVSSTRNCQYLQYPGSLPKIGPTYSYV